MSDTPDSELSIYGNLLGSLQGRPNPSKSTNIEQKSPGWDLVYDAVSISGLLTLKPRRHVHGLALLPSSFKIMQL